MTTPDRITGPITIDPDDDSSGPDQALTPAGPGALDLTDPRITQWMQQCGMHDYGVLEYGCACPEGDPRPVVCDLVREVERLRATAVTLPEREHDGTPGPLPLLPDSAYPPGATPLDPPPADVQWWDAAAQHGPECAEQDQAAGASFPVFVVVDWPRHCVHGITTDREKSRQWCRDVITKHKGDPLANLAVTQTVALVAAPPSQPPTWSGDHSMLHIGGQIVSMSDDTVAFVYLGSDGKPRTIEVEHTAAGVSFTGVDDPDGVHAHNAPNGGTSVTHSAQEGSAGTTTPPIPHAGTQATAHSPVSPRHPLVVDAPVPPDDPVVVLDIGPNRLARLNALRAAEHGDIRGTNAAVRRLDGPALNRLGATCRTLAQACEAEVLRRNAEDWTETQA